MREIDTYIVDYINANIHNIIVCSREKLRNEHGKSSITGVMFYLSCMTKWKQQVEQQMEWLLRPIIWYITTCLTFITKTAPKKKGIQLLNLFCALFLESNDGKL